MSRSLKLYLNDILTSIDKIQEYSEGLEKEAFLKHSLIFDAVTLNLQIIGEASKKIPEQIRNQYPHIPWRNIIGLRNIIAHTYFYLDEDILWHTIQHELEPLQKCIQELWDKEA
ncbi:MULTISPECIES: HepT-like ribonuclease domain-containing protein [unclassified Picosynechococcus]|uniref:HepT-like ribonuclease domain-containing protein n=1 Tax=unclassified Picosynechococcus TaxID=3079910 RepID=UPI0004AA25E8|nr:MULTISPECIES: DUF86 domain-containing protein [unclassified Picosynechococcus]AMA10737.1 hypothetical protein AWQ23_14920 [Picosynechococcus sp. PCC 73109]ANV89142.1 hypothetical protein AWQ22_15085 [Picosynechococcus sp. PCC 7117]ANV92129.1 hypothetical protein AWQ24_15235 [Picosynechococcus sp. PCC 8807]